MVDVVTPAVLMQGTDYMPVPEGFGGEPTKYQLTDDPSLLVTIVFPSVAISEQMQDLALKLEEKRQEAIDAMTKDIKGKAKKEDNANNDEEEDNESMLRASVRFSPALVRMQYDMVRMIISVPDGAEAPPVERCYEPMIMRVLRDFTTARNGILMMPG